MGSADDRRFEVLRAIVADFVSTKEPIGSKSLVERHNLGVSSATVRNDMAVLEAEGYIAQPHTSSGRVPTEKGYREFVDRLEDVKPLSSAERRAILGFLESGVDLDDVLRRAVRLLAQLTRQVAIVQYPTLSTSSVRHLEVVALTPAKLLLVVITDTGRVDQRIVELGDALDEHDVAKLRDLLGQALEGKPLAAASIAVSDLAPNLNGKRRARRRGRPVCHGAGRDAGRAQRGAADAGRHGKPHPQHRGFRRVASLGARSARGTGGGAATAGGAAGGRARSPCASATRPRLRRWRAHR